MSVKEIKILIVEDEPAIAMDIKAILKEQGYNVVGIAKNATKAFDLLAIRKPDIALLDISIEGSQSGIDIAKVMRDKHQIPFVFLTSHSDRDTIQQVTQTAPYGYIVKPFKDQDLAPAIEIALMRFENEKNEMASFEVLNQNLTAQLTHREYETLRLVYRGMSNKEMCEHNNLSVNTIKSHISNLYSKLNVNNRSALLAKIRVITK